MSTLEIGAIIDGRYRVECVLGDGAMGTVYGVEHIELGTPMALKVLRPEFSSTPQMQERFNREGRATAQLDHPCIVRVSDFGRADDGQLFLAMERVAGQTLSAVAKAGLDDAGAFDVTSQVLEALEHAHARGVVHRDLKPDNILLVEGGERTVKVLDFGLAKLTNLPAEADVLTTTGVVCGTPRYMSPEQASGAPVDGRSDLYAVGVMLFELLVGRPPFMADDVRRLLLKHMTEPPPPLPTRADGVAAVITKALAKDPDDRFEDAAAFRAALDEARVTPAKSSRRWLLIGAAAALVAATGVALVSGGDRALDEAEAALEVGDLERARMLALGSEQTAEAHGLLASIAMAGGDYDEAATALKTAVDAGLSIWDAPKLRAVFWSIVGRGEASTKSLIRLASRDPRDTPLLAELTERAPKYAHRRLAYEGLETHDATDRVDRFAFLSRDLKNNGTDVCRIRRWYVGRLAALNDPRALPLLEKELRRRSGFLSLGRSSGCMRAELRRAIKALKSTASE